VNCRSCIRLHYSSSIPPVGEAKTRSAEQEKEARNASSRPQFWKLRLSHSLMLAASRHGVETHDRNAMTLTRELREAGSS